jgi:hypothetical protein
MKSATLAPSVSGLLGTLDSSHAVIFPRHSPRRTRPELQPSTRLLPRRCLRQFTRRRTLQRHRRFTRPLSRQHPQRLTRRLTQPPRRPCPRQPSPRLTRLALQPNPRLRSRLHSPHRSPPPRVFLANSAQEPTHAPTALPASTPALTMDNA